MSSMPPTTAGPGRNARPAWTRGYAEVLMCLLCLWAWIAPMGAQPRLYRFLVMGILLDLIVVGPLVLMGGGLRARGRSAIASWLFALFAFGIASSALYLFTDGTGQGVFGAVAAIAVLVFRMWDLRQAPGTDGLRGLAFIIYGTLGLLVLAGSIVAFAKADLPDFGAAWPQPTAMGFGSDDPEQLIAHPPRMLVPGALYFAALALMRRLLTPARLEFIGGKRPS